MQKAFNEVYRSFNATQAPFLVADFILPAGACLPPCRPRRGALLTPAVGPTVAGSCDINVSPDKRTILLHSEGNLIQALKVRL